MSEGEAGTGDLFGDDLCTMLCMVQAVAQSMLRMRGAEAAIEQAWPHYGQHNFKNEVALVRLLEEAKAAGLDGRTSPIMDLVQKRITMVCVCGCSLSSCVSMLWRP